MKGQMWHQNSCDLDGKVEPLDTFLFYILFAVLQNHMELLSILLSSTILSTWQYLASVRVVIETNNFWVWKSVEMFKLTFYNHSNSNMTWKYKICFEGMQKACFVKALFDQSHWWNSHWSVDGCECFSSTNLWFMSSGVEALHFQKREQMHKKQHKAHLSFGFRGH